MRLRWKTLAIMCTVLICLVAAMTLVMEDFLMDNIQALEERDARRNIEGAASVIADDIRSIDSTARDWAEWDDTYAFMEDGNRGYIQSNLVDRTFLELGLNVILYQDPSGGVIFSKAVDLETGEEIPIPPDLLEALSGTVEGASNSSEKGVSGIIALDHCLMMIAMRPILTSNGQGPARGTLLMGRCLDDAKIDEISSMTGLDVEIGGAGRQDGQQDSLQDGLPAVVVEPLDGERLMASMILEDVRGGPAAVISAISTRDAYMQGRAILWYLFLAISSAGLLLGGVAVIILERMVISPISALSASVGSIGDISTRVPVGGGNEISSLATSINRTLDSLDESNRRTRESEERYRDLFENSSDIILTADGEGRVLSLNKAAERVLGILAGEAIGMDLRGIIGDSGLHALKGSSQTTGGSRAVIVPEVEVRSRDGRRLMLEASGQVRGEDGGSGEVLWIIRDITERKMAEEELYLRDRLLAGLGVATNRLLTSEDYRSAVQESLEILGLASDADRVYVLEEDPSTEAEGRISLIFQWTRDGIKPVPEEPQFFPGWRDYLDEGAVVCGLVRDLQPPERDVLASRDAISALAIPMKISDMFAGFMVFEECIDERVWSDTEISILSVAVRSIGGSLVRNRAEEALQESEERLRAIFEAAQDCISLKGTDLRYIKVNPAVERIYGLPAEAIIGRTHKELFGPGAELHIEARDSRALLGEVVEGEYTETLNGVPLIFHFIEVPIHDEGGEVAGICCIAREITERKRAEERLQLLESAVDNTDEAVIIMAGEEDPGDVSIVYVNEAFVRIMGYEPDEVIGRSPALLAGPRTDKAQLRRFAEAVAGKEALKTEILSYRRDGTAFWAEINMVPVQNDRGEVTYWVALGRDTTERRRSEEQIRFQASLLGQVKNAVVATDLEGRIVYWNSFSETMYQWKAEEALGQVIFETMVPEGEIGRLMSAAAEASLRGYSEGEITVRRKDGSTFPAYCSYGTIKDARGIDVGYVGVGVDITDLKRAEARLTASLQEKEVLLKEIHHRVKNNLQVISSLLNLQAGYIKDDEALEAFRESQDRIKSMALIHEKLYRSDDLSRVNFAEYARNLATSLKRSYGAEGIQLRMDLGEASLSIDRAIPCGLIINELLSNCFKHAFPTGKGTICMEVSFDGEVFTLAVLDDGVGLPEGLDIDGAPTLGLRLVHRLVRQLRGSIDIQRGQGTRFVITFPTDHHANQPEGD